MDRHIALVAGRHLDPFRFPGDTPGTAGCSISARRRADDDADRLPRSPPGPVSQGRSNPFTVDRDEGSDDPGRFEHIAKRHTLSWFQGQPAACLRKWFRASAARRSLELAMDAADIIGHAAEVSVQDYSRHPACMRRSGMGIGWWNGERAMLAGPTRVGRGTRALGSKANDKHEPLGMLQIVDKAKDVADFVQKHPGVMSLNRLYISWIRSDPWEFR